MRVALKCGPPVIPGHVCAAAHVLEPNSDRTTDGPNIANIAQSVERIHGKDEVHSSILCVGSKTKNSPREFFVF